MDYAKMLFALHVRDRAMEQTQRQMPANLEAPAREAFIQRYLPLVISEIVEELKGVSDLIHRAE